LTVLHTESKDQQYILATHSYQHNSLGITAVAYSHAKKIIAVAEKVFVNFAYFNSIFMLSVFEGGTCRYRDIL